MPQLSKPITGTLAKTHVTTVYLPRNAVLAFLIFFFLEARILIYLHMKGLACQQLQAVDKGFASLIISWISSMVLSKKKKGGEEGQLEIKYY